MKGQYPQQEIEQLSKDFTVTGANVRDSFATGRHLVRIARALIDHKRMLWQKYFQSLIKKAVLKLPPLLILLLYGGDEA